MAYFVKEDALVYAIRISEVLPTLKKLDTLASRYNVAHNGAGGCGLESAKDSENYEAVANYLKSAYLDKFIEIADMLIKKASESEKQGKTQNAKINAWKKTKEEILRGFSEFKYDLQGLRENVDSFVRQIDEEIAKLNSMDVK